MALQTYAHSQLLGPRLPAFSFLPSSYSVSEIRLPQISTATRRHLHLVCSSSDASGKKGVPNTNYVVPLNKSFSPANSSCITRPLAEILRDLNKRIPDNIAPKVPQSDPQNRPPATFIPWFHANRMLSFYAPGWCGEIRDVIFSDNGSVTVVYRVTVRGSDGEAHRESTGTVSATDSNIEDPVAAAEEIAFCKACARFGLGFSISAWLSKSSRSSAPAAQGFGKKHYAFDKALKESFEQDDSPPIMASSLAILISCQK